MFCAAAPITANGNKSDKTAPIQLDMSIWRPFVPRLKAHVAPEFWKFQILSHLIQLALEFRSFLTILSWYHAIGVGNSSASVTSVVIYQEALNLFTPIFGLYLTAKLQDSVHAADFARCISARRLLLSPFFCGIWEVLLHIYPTYLWSNRIAHSVCVTIAGVFGNPAWAAFTSHINAATDPVARAEVERIRTNQRLLVTGLVFLLKFFFLNLDTSTRWAVVPLSFRGSPTYCFAPR